MNLASTFSYNTHQLNYEMIITHKKYQLSKLRYILIDQRLSTHHLHFENRISSTLFID